MKRAVAFLMTVMCGAPQQEHTSPVQLPSAPASASASASAAPRVRDYDDELADFFRSRWSAPAHAGELCVVFQVNVSPRMLIWHVRQDPVHASGDDRFDDSVRNMLQKLLDERTPLPEPPDEFADVVRGHGVNLAFSARALRPFGGQC